jgi:AAHS family 4-hydroxybenzoate transporter-like MFS transporter
VAPTAAIAIRDVVDRNPISRFQYRTLCLCFLCIVVDGLEVTVVGFLPAALKNDWGIGTAQLAPAMTAGLIGLGVGALAGGPLGDRFGRRKIIVWAICTFMMTTLLTATSDGVLAFSSLRLLTGIGLGASMPNVAALVSEIVPTNRRRSIVAVVWSGFPTGAAVGAITMPFIVDAFGWRAAILVCGIIAGAVFACIRFLLPESPMFLADTGGNPARLVKYCNAIEPGSANGHSTFERETDMYAKSYPIGALLTRDLRTGTLTLWVGYMAVMFTIYLTNTWLPYLFKEAGFATGSISVLTTALQIGGAVGCAAIGFIQDRIGPHLTLIWASVVGAGVAVAIAISPSATAVLGILVFALGMCTNAISTGYTAISTTFYPTAIRSTGTSWTAGMSRIGAVLGAGVGTSLASMGVTLQQVFLLMLAPITIGAVCMAIKGLSGQRNANVPDVEWMSADLTTTGVNPTPNTTNGA